MQRANCTSEETDCATVMQCINEHWFTFGEKGSNFFPVCWVVIKYDAIFIHANALQSKLASKSRNVMPVFHYMEHTWGSGKETGRKKPRTKYRFIDCTERFDSYIYSCSEALTCTFSLAESTVLDITCCSFYILQSLDDKCLENVIRAIMYSFRFKTFSVKM